MNSLSSNVCSNPSKRDAGIDILRWLALTGIILVHTKPGVFWSQLRSFDVPMMVMLSAICFGMSGGGINYAEYIKKRFVRLIVPTWIFLTGYFFVEYILTSDISFKKLIMCYTLTTKWYFWIVRILFGMAIIAPLLKIVSERISYKHVLIFSILLFIITELLSTLSSTYLYKVIIMFIPYIAFYLIGMIIKDFPETNILKCGILFLLIYLAIAIYLYCQTGGYVLTGKFKYPPRIYYDCYALGSSALLWVFRRKIVLFLQKSYLYNLAKFVGSHTFWIYLWHIPIVDYMVNKYNSLWCFVVVYLSAIMITYIQSLLVEKCSERIDNPVIRKNIRNVFIG